MKKILPLLLLGPLLFSCAPKPPDVAQVRKTIEAMTAKSEQEMLAGTWDTTLANFTDDAVSMPNFMPMSKGKKAIREQYAQMMGTGMKFTNVDFVMMDLQVSGEYAYEIGTYSMTFEMPPMGQMTDAGKYVTVYQQAKDGSWKVKVETWNSDKEPAAPGTGG
jgi:ketosteroid isomerase-like protein